ncbi:methylated-DNA--[protein]-cysteine S-methyltransferase, partial [Vibrio sinaloensis]
MSTYYTVFTTPLGEMTLQADADGLLGAWFETQTTQPKELGQYTESDSILNNAIKQLQEYFCGERTEFNLPLSARGTQFQQQVWHALTTIPYGETWSYQELANAIGNPK